MFAGFINPILHIEELRRFPAFSSRVPAPGTALVFRSRNGKLHAPRGGHTAGELFWLGPRGVYQIDTTEHDFELRLAVDGLLADVTGRWVVDDPVAVVAHRLSDLEHVCVAELRRRAETAAPDESRLRAVLGGEVRLPGGVRLFGLRVAVVPAAEAIGETGVRFLVGDDADDDLLGPAAADSGQMIAEIRAVADAALAAYDGADGTIRVALSRFRDMVARLGSTLPQSPDRASDAAEQ